MCAALGVLGEGQDRHAVCPVLGWNLAPLQNPHLYKEVHSTNQHLLPALCLVSQPAPHIVHQNRSTGFRILSGSVRTAMVVCGIQEQSESCKREGAAHLKAPAPDLAYPALQGTGPLELGSMPGPGTARAVQHVDRQPHIGVCEADRALS